MSSASDQYIVNDVLTDSDKEIFFKQKRWNYVVDSSSTGGVFPQQIQFNLNTVGAMGNFVNLREAYVQYPYRVRIYNNGSASQTPATAATLSTVLKNGFWHTIDSAQLVLDNETINMNQKYTNIPAHFRALTTWNEDAFNEFGTTLGLSLPDDFPTVGTAAGLNNIDIDVLIPANNRGVDLTTTANTSIPVRQYEQNIDANTPTTALNHIAGASNARLSGKAQVQANGANAVAVNADCYVQFVLVTVRLKDICPAVDKLPPIQNLTGMLYINHNSARCTFTTSNSNIAVWSYSTISGSSMPAQLLNVATTGFQPASGATNTWTLEASVSGVPSVNLTTAQPPINYGRLVFSYYEPNPDVQATMSITKSIRYNETFNNYFNISANGSFSGTITPGLPNVKGLLLVPYYTSVTRSTGNPIVYDPLTSPFEVAPASTSVLPILKNLTVTYGNQPVFTQPLNMSYEVFLNEISALGETGGQDNKTISGILSERLWSNLYRYNYIDLSRRVISDENQSKSIQVSCENGTRYPMNVLAFVFYEKEFTIDCATGKVTRG